MGLSIFRSEFVCSGWKTSLAYDLLFSCILMKGDQGLKVTSLLLFCNYLHSVDTKVWVGGRVEFGFVLTHSTLFMLSQDFEPNLRFA